MNKRTLGTSAALLLLAATVTNAQSLLSDNFNVTGLGTGFGLGSGVNTQINPPTTRLTGSLAPNMRYLVTDSTKTVNNYSITGSRLQVAAAANSGRFSLSTDGSTPFDFGSSLGTGLATAVNPVVYDITISMANNSAGTQRFSLGFGTAENNANFWDFGLQLYRANAADNFYTIQKRIDRVSYTTATDSTGTTSDINAAITTTGASTFGSQLDFLIRVTDAGAETTTFNSRVQISMDNGDSWFYDTATDGALASGFRFDTTSRFFMWDIASQAATTYDNFSIALVPEPSLCSLALLAGAVALVRRVRR